MRNAFRTPGFPRLFAGLAASMFGDSLMLIVLSMWVKDADRLERRRRPDLPLDDRPGAAGPAVRLCRRPGAAAARSSSSATSPRP